MTPASDSERPGTKAEGRTRVFRWIMWSGVLFVMASGLLSAEWLARSYEKSRATPPDYFPQMYYPHRYLRYGLVPGLDYYGWFKINSMGFRGREVQPEKAPGEFRIVVLGASTTFDIGSIGKSRPWPEVMEEELRRLAGNDSIEVLNLGIPGSTSLVSLIDFQTRAIDLQPDMVIVYQGHNDFIYSFAASIPPRSGLYPQEHPPRSAFIRWLTYHSLLYAKSNGHISDVLARLKAAVTPHRADEGASRDPTVGLERGLGTFASNIRSVTAVARDRGVPLVVPQIVLPFPDATTTGCEVCAGLSRVFNGLDPQRVKAMIERYDDVSLTLSARDENLHFIRTDGFVPREDRYYHDPIHFGPEGSRRMGESMAAALLPLVNRVSAAK